MGDVANIVTDAANVMTNAVNEGVSAEGTKQAAAALANDVGAVAETAIAAINPMGGMLAKAADPLIDQLLTSVILELLKAVMDIKNKIGMSVPTKLTDLHSQISAIAGK